MKIRRSTRQASLPILAAAHFLFVLGCGEGPGGGSRGPEGAGTPGADSAAPAIRFANHCSATGPDVTLVTPAEAREWAESQSPYCVVLDDDPDGHGGFDPLGYEAICATGDSLPPWASSKELFAVVTAAGGGSRTLHVLTRIEETEEERCVDCYPEEAGCAGGSTFRELSRDVSLTIPESGGNRVVPLTELRDLDYERKVLSLTLLVELLDGDSVLARDSLAPAWPRCC